MKIEFQNESRFFVHLFAWGEVLHKKGDVTVDREFYSEMKRAFLFLTTSDDRPPQYPGVKRQHGDDGFVYGFIADIFSTDEHPAPPGFETEGVYIEVVPSPWLAQRYHVDGLIRDWSPGFDDDGWTDPHTGTEFKYVLRETSFVSEGHLKNTEKQSPAYALSADGFVTTLQKEAVLAEKETSEETTEMETEENADIAARVSAIEAGQAKIAEQVARLVASLKDGDDEGEGEEESEMEGDDKEMSAMKKRQGELEKQFKAERALRLKTQAEARIDKSNLQLEADEREKLMKLAASDPETFNDTVDMLSAKDEKIRKLSATEPTNPYAFTEVGNMGGPAAEPKPLGEFRKLCAQVKESGVTSQLKAIDTLASKQALNLMDDSDMSAKGPILDEFFPSN